MRRRAEQLVEDIVGEAELAQFCSDASDELLELLVLHAAGPPFGRLLEQRLELAAVLDESVGLVSLARAPSRRAIAQAAS